MTKYAVRVHVHDCEFQPDASRGASAPARRGGCEATRFVEQDSAQHANEQALNLLTRELDPLLRNAGTQTLRVIIEAVTPDPEGFAPEHQPRLVVYYDDAAATDRP
jgi:hypothetical protein